MEICLANVLPDGIDRKIFRILMLILTFILTIICLIQPEVNHNALHFFAIPCVLYTVIKVSYIFYIFCLLIVY